VVGFQGFPCTPFKVEPEQCAAVFRGRLEADARGNRQGQPPPLQLVQGALPPAQAHICAAFERSVIAVLKHNAKEIWHVDGPGHGLLCYAWTLIFFDNLLALFLACPSIV
jgi:hypothetical protein